MKRRTRGGGERAGAEAAEEGSEASEPPRGVSQVARSGCRAPLPSASGPPRGVDCRAGWRFAAACWVPSSSSGSWRRRKRGGKRSYLGRGLVVFSWFTSVPSSSVVPAVDAPLPQILDEFVEVVTVSEIFLGRPSMLVVSRIRNAFSSSRGRSWTLPYTRFPNTPLTRSRWRSGAQSGAIVEGIAGFPVTLSWSCSRTYFTTHSGAASVDLSVLLVADSLPNSI